MRQTGMSCTVCVEVGNPMIKSISLLARRAHLSHDDFVRHWVDVHVPMSHQVPGLVGYTISHIAETLTHPHAPLIRIPREIDGIAGHAADCATPFAHHRISAAGNPAA